MLLKEKRFLLDQVSLNNFEEMKKIIQNRKLMFLGWGKIYSDSEVIQWIDKIINQYKEYGYSYFLIKDITEKKPIGLVGLLPTTINYTNYLEVAYIIEQEYQGQGFAVESVQALIKHFSQKVDRKLVIAQFVPENVASKKVAERLGMTFQFSYDRKMNGKLQKHIVYGF